MFRMASASKKWRRKWLNRVWYVDQPATLWVRATPSVCMQTLVTAARPSTTRLHHRNLFASGRRYHFEAHERGFQMITTSKVSWHYRRRTRNAAVMVGQVEASGAQLTQMQLRSHLAWVRVLEFAFVPTFMTSILIYVPWNPLLLIGLILSMYGLSWAALWYSAALDANEMVYFVQTALDDLGLVEAVTLTAGNAAETVDVHGFVTEWERFYQQHKPQQPPTTSTID